MTKSETILEALLAIGFKNEQIRIADSDYRLPDEKYVAGLGYRVRDFLISAGLDFEDERFDCDNFALEATAYAKREQGKYGRQPADIAFGFAWVVHREIGAHAINLAVVETAGEIEVLFYEPQPMPLCLTEVDRGDISSLLFCYV